MAHHQLADPEFKALHKALQGCSGCDYDEAEGGLVSHCAACQFTITEAAYVYVSKELQIPSEGPKRARHKRITQMTKAQELHALLGEAVVVIGYLPRTEKGCDYQEDLKARIRTALGAHPPADVETPLGTGGGYTASELTEILEVNVREPLTRLLPEEAGRPVERLVAEVVRRFGCPTCGRRADIHPCDESGTIHACNDAFHTRHVASNGPTSGERVRDQLAFGLTAELTKLPTYEVVGGQEEYVSRERVMELVMRWRMQWDGMRADLQTRPVANRSEG